uniref:BTB domain-containing protein n=1 Tax=Panagrolaimus davidi TaxID=227884 RepID=A0A914P3M1_9BILA
MQKPTERKPFRPDFSNPPTQKTSTSSFSPAASGNTAEIGAFAKASEKYMANNFSKGLDIPVKPITVTHITCESLDEDWQEPITPRPQIVKNKRVTNRFVKPFPPQTPAMPGNASAANDTSLPLEPRTVSVSSKDSMPQGIERRDIPQHKLKDPYSLAEKPQRFVRSISSQCPALADASLPDLLVQRTVSVSTKDDMPLESKLHTIGTPANKFMDFVTTSASIETFQHSSLTTATNSVNASANFDDKASTSSASHVQNGDNKENASISERYTQVCGSSVTLPSLVQSPDKEIVATTLKAASFVSPQNDNVTVSTSRPVSQVSVTIKTNVEQQTDETSAVSSPLQATNKLGLALYALPEKDFSFKLENGKMVLIHKNVLAVQSSHFYQQFYKSNDGSDCENVYDFDEEAVTLMVKACYEQHFDESILDDNVCEKLVKLATKYNIQCVMNLLPQYLSKRITEESVCSIAVRAYETNDSALRQECAIFIADSLTQKFLPGIENLPIEFNKEIILVFFAKNKK